jgi:hypothetical protein
MTIMYNRSGIWASRPRNTDLWPVFSYKLAFFCKTEGYI